MAQGTVAEVPQELHSRWAQGAATHGWYQGRGNNVLDRVLTQ